MYDPDTVRHITGCLRSLSTQKNAEAQKHRRSAEETSDPNESNAHAVLAVATLEVAYTLSDLAYMLEGDYAG